MEKYGKMHIHVIFSLVYAFMCSRDRHWICLLLFSEYGQAIKLDVITSKGN